MKNKKTSKNGKTDNRLTSVDIYDEVHLCLKEHVTWRKWNGKPHLMYQVASQAILELIGKENPNLFKSQLYIKKFVDNFFKELEE